MGPYEQSAGVSHSLTPVFVVLVSGGGGGGGDGDIQEQQCDCDVLSIDLQDLVWPADLVPSRCMWVSVRGGRRNMMVCILPQDRVSAKANSSQEDSRLVMHRMRMSTGMCTSHIASGFRGAREACSS